MTETNNEGLETIENLEIVEETKEEIVEPTIYNVILDENGYFTGMACIAKYSRFEGGIDVESLPPDTDDNIMKKSYKLADGIWEFDEERYEELLEEERKRQEEEASKPVEPTVEEQIEQLKMEKEVLTATMDSILTEVIPSLFI